MRCVKRTMMICAVLIALLFFQVCYCAESADDVVNGKNSGSDERQLPTPKVGARSLEKCKEYEYSVVVNRSCLFDAFTPLGGDFEAQPEEFPHMALIGYGNDENKDWLCGGTLISDRFVLIAAHCLTSRAHGLPTIVRLGDVNLNRNSSVNVEHVQQIRIKESIAHPDFSFPSAYNDIGLLKLETPAKFDAYVRPACLYTKNQTESEYVFYTSWDYTDHWSTSTLWRKTWKVMTTEKCRSAFPPIRRLPNGIVGATQICAGPQFATNDDCRGDIGGPLTVYKDTRCMFDVIGTTSFSRICGSNTPSVFTKVYPYLKWIEDIVWP